MLLYFLVHTKINFWNSLGLYSGPTELRLAGWLDPGTGVHICRLSVNSVDRIIKLFIAPRKEHTKLYNGDLETTLRNYGHRSSIYHLIYTNMNLINQKIEPSAITVCAERKKKTKKIKYVTIDINDHRDL